MEIWKDIDGLEGVYQISNLGNVKSKNHLRHKDDIILKPQKTKDGYYRVGLRKNGTYNLKAIHRLVAIAFIENPNNYPVVNHKNEIKTDNTIENLEWCTVLYNNCYGTHLEKLRKARFGMKFPQEWRDNISKGRKGKKFGSRKKAKEAILNYA